MRIFLLLLAVSLSLWTIGCTPTTAEPTPTIEIPPTSTVTEASTPTIPAPSPPATPEPMIQVNCHEESVTYVMETEEAWEEWLAVFDFPGMSPTLQDMENSIPRLAGVREQAAAIEPPPCAAYIHDYLLAYMDKFIALWEGILNGDSDMVTNYQANELDALYRLYETGFVALKVGTDLALFPTPTPKSIVAGPDNTPITLPTTLTILATGDSPDIDVRESAGGNRRSCRLEDGLEVNVVETSWDRAYLRIEGTDCDGWVQSSKVTP